MRLPSILFGLTAVSTLSLAVPPAEAAPPGGKYVCATTLSGAAGTPSTYTDVTTINPATCKSSIILAFDGNVPVLSNVRDQIQLAVDTCGLWDGPYRRVAPGESGGNPAYDYVVMQVNSVSSSFDTAPQVTANAATQIGVPGTLRARFFGTTSNNSAVVSFVDQSNSLGPVASQTLDYPGPEFLYMTKSQGGGGQQATLLCSVNAWFWDGIPMTPLTPAEQADYSFGGTYGISAYPVMHNVNQLTAGWGAGPSGLLSTANINSACGVLNGTLTQGSPSPSGDEPRQQYAGRIFGTYKAGATAGSPPTFNSTNCAARDFPNAMSSYERICTTLEPSGYGRPNSCNPTGGLGSGVTASVIQTKDGQNTTCTTLSFTSGTRLSSYSAC